MQSPARHATARRLSWPPHPLRWDDVSQECGVIGHMAVKLKWTPGNKNSGATSGQDGVTCSRQGSVGAFCMK